MITHQLSATTPDDPAYEIRPSHWNAGHVQAFTILGNTAGASTVSGTNIALSAGPNATISVNGSTLVFSGGAGAAGNTGYLSANGVTASLGTVELANGNGITWGIDGQTVTASHDGLTTAAASNHSHGNPTLALTNLTGTTASNSAGLTLSLSAAANQTGISGVIASDATYTSGTISFSNQNGVTIGSSVDGASQYVRLSVATSYAASNHSHGNPTLALTNLSGTTASASNGLTLSLAANAPFVAGVSNAGNTAGDTGMTSTRLVLVGTNNVTLSQATGAAGATVTVVGANTHAQQTGISGVIVSDATYTSGTISFSNQNGVTIGSSVNGASQYVRLSVATSYAASNHSHGNPTLALTNLTGTTASASNGFTLSLSAADPGAAAEANHHHLLGANTAGNTTASGSTIGLSGINLTLSGTNDSVVNISAPATSSLVGVSGISISTNGSTISVYQPARSSFQNIDGAANQSMTLDGASVSHAVAFYMPQNGSFSFLRIPVLMTTNSTTIATTAATRSVSGQIRSTWNAVIYSLGVGANSKSLQSVASGSNGWTFMNSLSIAVNGTQYSVTQAFSANAEGAGTTRTTQYSISNTNYSLTTNQIATEWSSGRFLDIPMAASLSAGPYWLVFGYSTSALTNSAGAWSNANVRYSNHFGQSATNMAFGVMGSTNLTSGGLMGAGSFSTAGGGTTASLPISAISSSASHVVPMFQLLRSA